jgi:hypothetical protein
VTVEPERRYTSSRVEARAAEGTGGPRIAGYAARFNKYSEDLGGWIERIAPSAFNMSKGVGWPRVVARYNHDPNMILGTIAGGTLTLTTDEVGLFYEVEPPRTRADVVELVERGDVSQSSFAFQLTGEGSDEWDVTESGMPRRTLLSVRLIDVAPVWLPAYPDTDAAIRSLAKHVAAPPEQVRSLAAKGALKKLLSRSDAPHRTPAQASSYLDAKRDPWSHLDVARR